jgi:hypothetical protein
MHQRILTLRYHSLVPAATYGHSNAGAESAEAAGHRVRHAVPVRMALN